MQSYTNKEGEVVDAIFWDGRVDTVNVITDHFSQVKLITVNQCQLKIEWKTNSTPTFVKLSDYLIRRSDNTVYVEHRWLFDKQFTLIDTPKPTLDDLEEGDLVFEAFYSLNQINSRIFVRSSTHYVWIRRFDSNAIERSAKSNTDVSYHPTWIDAKDKLIDVHEQKVTNLQQSIEYALEQLRIVKKLSNESQSK